MHPERIQCAMLPLLQLSLLPLLAFGQLAPDLSGYSSMYNSSFGNGTEIMAFVNNPLCLDSAPSTTEQDLKDAGYKTAVYPDTNGLSRLNNLGSIVGQGDMYRGSAFGYTMDSFSFAYPTNSDSWKGTLAVSNAVRRDGKYNSSNIAIALWVAVVPSLGIRANELTNVIHLGVSNAVCKPILEEIFKVKKEKMPAEGKFVEYKQGTREFYALVGCPNGKGVGYLLMQNRAVLGRKTIRSIKIWGGAGTLMDEDYPLLNLQFVIENFPT